MSKMAIELTNSEWLDSSALLGQYEYMQQAGRELREELRTMYIMIKAIGLGENGENWRRALINLRDYTLELTSRLEQHAETESQRLYPVLKRYGAPELGMLNVFEQERELAKLYTDDFLRGVGLMPEHVSNTMAKSIASSLLQAYYIWLEHLRKEEEILFPMTQQFLKKKQQHFM